MIFYLTYNDTPSGIYSSQVIDVVNFFNNNLNTKTKLVAFISIRSFFTNRKKIKNQLTEAIVLPMFPGVHRWRYNSLLLNLYSAIYKPSIIIGRSVLATQLAFKTKNTKVIYDGRGAIAAEWEEYQVITNTQMLSEIATLEKAAILNSDYRIAVSHQLVKYWQEQYQYNKKEHVVIPCTLNHIFEKVTITQENIDKNRKALGLQKEDVVFVYSGSIAGWQSFDVLSDFIKPRLQTSRNIKLLFLSGNDTRITQLQQEFKEQVIVKKISPSEVPHYLLAADYGLLIREESTTNKVASPVKFAEYLACGLKVIISDHLGDYTDFVKQKDCGYLYTNNSSLNKITLEEKIRIQAIALSQFTKEHYVKQYEVTI